jgi:hypothetical protein
MKLLTTTFGDDIWPADRENLQAFFKTVRDLGLDETVAGQSGATQPTALGRELKLDLMMAFVGATDMWEIPGILEDHGYIDDIDVETLICGGGKRRIKWLVRRSYFEFCNRTERTN